MNNWEGKLQNYFHFIWKKNGVYNLWINDMLGIVLSCKNLSKSDLDNGYIQIQIFANERWKIYSKKDENCSIFLDYLMSNTRIISLINLNIKSLFSFLLVYNWYQRHKMFYMKEFWIIYCKISNNKIFTIYVDWKYVFLRQLSYKFVKGFQKWPTPRETNQVYNFHIMTYLYNIFEK